MNTGTITSKGQLTMPKELREKLALKPGDKVYWTYEDGGVMIRPKNRPIMDLAGFLHDPGRKAMSDEELETAVGDAVAQR